MPGRVRIEAINMCRVRIEPFVRPPCEAEPFRTAEHLEATKIFSLICIGALDWKRDPLKSIGAFAVGLRLGYGLAVGPRRSKKDLCPGNGFSRLVQRTSRDGDRN